MIAAYLKETFSYIIDHFQVETRRHFNLSFKYAVLCSLSLLPLAIIYVVIGGFAYGYISFSEDISHWYDRISRTNLITNTTDLGQSLGVLFMGLYGSFVISCINDSRLQTKKVFTWRDLREFISRDEFMWFLRFMAVILVTYFITVKGLTEWLIGPKTRMGALSGLFSDQFSYGNSLEYRLLQWLDSIIILIRSYLPYIFSTLFIITVYENDLNKEILRKYKTSIITAFIIAFTVNQLSAVLIIYVKVYVLGLTDAIFLAPASMMIPGFLKMAAVFLGAAFFTWSIATAIAYPVKLRAEEEYRADAGPETESAIIEAEEEAEIQPD